MEICSKQVTLGGFDLPLFVVYYFYGLLLTMGRSQIDCILLGWISRPRLGFLQEHLILSDYFYPAGVLKCHSYNIAWECFRIESSKENFLW